MLDQYGREINYLRVSVTDRCNLRCRYCMPDEGVESVGHDNVLTTEQIVRVITIAAKLGIRKVRLTGGEPLIRGNITGLIAEMAKIPLIDDIALTTNGILFDGMAEELKAAGLNRVNFSLDTLVAEKFNYITRRVNLADVMQSIDKAFRLGMAPVKINTVVIKGFNDDEILDLVTLAAERPLHVRFIELMPIGGLPFYNREHVLSMGDVKRFIESRYELLPPPFIQHGGPAKYYQIKGGMGTVGFISPMSSHFCFECNRIRMTADGKLRGCLFGKQETNLRMALKRDAGDEELKALFCKAVQQKLDQHHMNDGWGADNERKMSQIGG